MICSNLRMKTNIQTKIKEIAKKLVEIKQRNGLEQAYYQPLCDLIELIGNDELGFSIKANPCPTKIKAGYPDIEIFKQRRSKNRLYWSQKTRWWLIKTRTRKPIQQLQKQPSKRNLYKDKLLGALARGQKRIKNY